MTADSALRTRAWVGLGSNLEQPARQLEQAFDALAGLPGSRLLARSSLYASAPMGPQDQPDYVNAVALLETALAPLVLLEALQDVELRHGRVRSATRWGPRTLDLDLLLYGDLVLDSPRLTLPHPGLKQRPFVVLPLLEVDPQLCLPDGTPLIEIASTLGGAGVTPLGADARRA